MQPLAFLEAAWCPLPTHPRDLCSFGECCYTRVLATCPAEGRLLLCLKLTLLGAPGLLRAPGKVLALEGMEETTAGLLKWGGEEGQLQRGYHTLGFSVVSQAKVLQWPFLLWS